MSPCRSMVCSTCGLWTPTRYNPCPLGTFLLALPTPCSPKCVPRWAGHSGSSQGSRFPVFSRNVWQVSCFSSVFVPFALFRVPLGTPITLFCASALQASYGVEDPEYAVTQLAQTTMRSELGKLSLDRVFRVSWGGGSWSCQCLSKPRTSCMARVMCLTAKCPLLRGLMASVSVDLLVNPWRWVLFRLFCNRSYFLPCPGLFGRGDGWCVPRPSWSSRVSLKSLTLCSAPVMNIPDPGHGVL